MLRLLLSFKENKWHERFFLGLVKPRESWAFIIICLKHLNQTKAKLLYFLSPYLLIPKRLFPKDFYLNFRYLSWCFSAGDFTAHDYERKPLKYTIMNFYIFVCKPISQICPKQIMSGAEFQIGQNNQYEIYGFHIISKHVNIWQRVIWFFSLISVSFHTGFQVKAALVSNWFSKKH